MVQPNHDDDARVVVPASPRIVLTGLDYLADNSAMRRAARAAKGIKDATPGL